MNFQAKRAGDFRVYNGERQEWDFDTTFRILCLDEKLEVAQNLTATEEF